MVHNRVLFSYITAHPAVNLLMLAGYGDEDEDKIEIPTFCVIT